MKRVYVNEKWCLGCHLCEYNCAYANTVHGSNDSMAKILMNKRINPRITVEEGDKVCFAVSCRHCEDAPCVKSCIAGAISMVDGVVTIDKTKCVGCLTCVLVCPFGAVMPSDEGSAQKCELCLKNSEGVPTCVAGCPNRAIVYEEKEATE